VVVHTYNPTLSRGRGKRIAGSRAAQGKLKKILSQKQRKNKRPGGTV
jgi:hypothetical protein